MYSRTIKWLIWWIIASNSSLDVEFFLTFNDFVIFHIWKLFIMWKCYMKFRVQNERHNKPSLLWFLFSIIKNPLLQAYKQRRPGGFPWKGQHTHETSPLRALDNHRVPALDWHHHQLIPEVSKTNYWWFGGVTATSEIKSSELIHSKVQKIV